MKDRSEVIFGNRINSKAYKKALRTKKKYYKKSTLQEFDVETTKLKAYLRLSFNLGFLPPKKYELWSERVVEIVKMLGGWLKTVNGRPST